jgi:hypothetical protein
MTDPLAITALFILLGAPLAIGIPVFWWPRHEDGTPEGIDCPFCHVEYPLTSIVPHMLTRGRCRGRPLSMRVLSTQRRRW